MIRKRVFIVVVLLLLVQKLFGIGFQIEVSGGYGFPAARDETWASYNVDSNGNITKWQDELVSYGNGIKLCINSVLLFNDYWGIMLKSGLSIKGGYDIKIKNDYEDPPLNSVENYSGSFVPIMLGLKLQAGSKKIFPYAYVTPGIIIPCNVGGKALIKDNAQDTVILDLDISDKFSVGFGISSGLGININLTNLIGITMEFAPTYATALLKAESITYEINDTLFTETVIFKKDTAKLPDPEIGDDYEIIYVHGEPFVSFSSIAAKIGVIFRF